MSEAIVAPVAPAPESTPLNTPAAQATPPVAPPVEKKETPAQARKKYQLKVDGVAEELELDINNEEEVKKHLQMSRAAQKRMQQFAEYEKGVKGLFDTLQKDPLKVISDPRLKISEEARRKMAEAIINNELAEMGKTPEQKEKEKLQKEFEDLKKQHETEKKAREAAEFSRLQEQAAVQLDSEISAAIEASKLPKFWAVAA